MAPHRIPNKPHKPYLDIQAQHNLVPIYFPSPISHSSSHINSMIKWYWFTFYSINPILSLLFSLFPPNLLSKILLILQVFFLGDSSMKTPLISHQKANTLFTLCTWHWSHNAWIEIIYVHVSPFWRAQCSCRQRQYLAPMRIWIKQ